MVDEKNCYPKAYFEDKGPFTRAEFIDFVAKEGNIENFVRYKIMDTYLESEIIHDRKEIRKSKRVNRLLHDNRFLLRKIYHKVDKMKL